jgi:hypothetical protein
MNPNSTRRGGAGLGLLLLLISILLILILLFGNFGGSKSYMQNVSTARKSAIEIKQEINTHELTQLLAACYLSTNTLPKTPEETGNEAVFRDPWGHQITFTYAKEGDKTYVIYHSNGPDGEPNTDDDVIRKDLLPI